MTEVANSPFFSVIIPTRNRPDFLLRAAQSVLQQDFGDYELIVVVDGSNEGNLQRYREIESEQPGITFEFMVHRPRGHGHSYSMNVGAAIAKGRYLCFIDDDDYWTDAGHLSRVYSSIGACDQAVDVHYSNQRAFHGDGNPYSGPVWLDDLAQRVEERWRVSPDCFRVDARFMINSAGFAHLNCTVFRSEFYAEIGGMDENIRYEDDRDVFIRAVDGASSILYCTRYVARHNIPDASRKQNLSTESTDIAKKLDQLRVFDKAICLCRQPCVIDACRRAKTYELKHVASILAAQGRHTGAAHYAREACLGAFNLRWMCYAFYLSLLALLRPGQKV